MSSVVSWVRSRYHNMSAAEPTTLAAPAQAMKDGQVYRKLGRQEDIMYAMYKCRDPRDMCSTNYTLVVDCERPLEARHVKMALEAFHKQMPILRARVEEREDGRYMVASDAPMSLTELPPGGDYLEIHVDRVNNEQLHNTPNGPHWKVAFMQNPRNTMTPSKLPHRAVLFLTMPHFFTDGMSQARVFANLLRSLDQAVQNGRVEELTPAPVCPSTDEIHEDVPYSRPVAKLLYEAFGLLLQDRKSAFSEAYVSHYDGRPLADPPMRMVSASLPPEEMGRLHAMCREHGLTVNAAISAAVSIAGARMVAKTPDGKENPGPYVLRTSYIVNTRRYLPPEVDRSQLFGCFVSYGATHVKVPSTSIENFWTVASNVYASLKRQIDLRMPLFIYKELVPLLIEPDSWNMEEQVKDSVNLNMAPFDYNINNIGNLDAVFPKTEAVVPVELHRSMRFHPALDHLFGVNLFQTLGGRLFYDLVYYTDLVQSEHAERFQKLVMEVLGEILDEKE